jgi:hypothetical protein
MIEEDMEEITKEWTVKFLVPVGDAELSNSDLIKSIVLTRTEYDGPSSKKKKKKKEELWDIDSASEETMLDSPGGGGGDEVNQEEEGKKTSNKRAK